MPTVTVKISDQQFARLERIARERHLPKAQVLREAFEGADARHSKPSAFDLAASLAGSVNGPRDASTNPAYLTDFGQPRARTRRKKING